MKTVKRGDFFARQGWYPKNPEACRRVIEEFSKTAKKPKDSKQTFHAGIVPHAGWSFSGGPAAAVFKALKEGDLVDRVVLFGGHMGPSSAGWILNEGVWETPLGSLQQDSGFAGALAQKGGGVFSEIGPDDYEPDNTIELQLPFVKYFFENAKIVVAGVPATSEGLALGRLTAELSSSMEREVEGEASNSRGRTIIVGSTDLTHYGINYGFMPKGLGPEAVSWVKEVNDGRALKNIQGLNAKEFLDDALTAHNACCPGAAGAALTAAKAMGSERGEVLDYFTSYDIQPGASFVGYAAAVM